MRAIAIVILSTLAGIVLSATVAVLWAVYSPMYEASALLKVRLTPLEILPSSQPVQLPKEIIERYRRTTVALVKREDLLAAAAKDDALQMTSWYARNKERAVEALEEAIVVSWLADTDYLMIGMRGSNPQELATIVNAVARAAVKIWNEPLMRDRERKIRKLDEELARLRRRQNQILIDLATGPRVSEAATATAKDDTLARIEALTKEVREIEGNINVIATRVLDMVMAQCRPPEDEMNGAVVVHSWATPPMSRISPRWEVTLPAGGGAGLLVGILIVLLRGPRRPARVE